MHDQKDQNCINTFLIKLPTKKRTRYNTFLLGSQT